MYIVCGEDFLVRKLGPEKTTDFHDPNLPPRKRLHHIVDSSGHGPPLLSQAMALPL